MKSRWQQYSHKVLRWNRMDKDTKSDTVKQSLDETDKGVEDKRSTQEAEKQVPEKHTTTPPSPSQSELASHGIPQVSGSSIERTAADSSGSY